MGDFCTQVLLHSVIKQSHAWIAKQSVQHMWCDQWKDFVKSEFTLKNDKEFLSIKCDNERHSWCGKVFEYPHREEEEI